MNPNYSHIYDRFVGGQSPREFLANSSHESIADAVAEYIRDMPAEWTEDEDMEEVADALVAYITDALTVTVSYAYVDSETRTERMGAWIGLRRSAIDAAIQHLGWEGGSYYADELGQHIEADEDDLVELGAGLIAAGRGDYSAAVWDADVYSLWAQRL